MHAASVHPEPGSNSRIFCINSLLSKCNYHSSFLLASFTFCLSSILFQNLTRSLSHYTLTRILYKFALYFLQSLVVQFSMTDSLFLKVYSFVIISHPLHVCQVLFLTFFKLFSGFLPHRVCDLVILPHSFPFVNTFFEKSFEKFKVFYQIANPPSKPMICPVKNPLFSVAIK